MLDMTVYFHGGCSDGYGAAWAVQRLLLTKDIEFIAYFHDSTVPSKEESRMTYFLDCAPSPTWVAKNVIDNGMSQEFMILDHHESTVRAWGDHPRVRVDLTRSGAVLAWKYFSEGQEVPSILRYVQDRDLWHFDLPESEAINAVIDSKARSKSEWDELNKDIANHFYAVVERGRTILDWQNQQIDSAIRFVHSTALPLPGFGLIPVLALNTPFMNSKIANRLADQSSSGVGATYHYPEPGVESWSLRSTPQGPNVAKMAEAFGGGGHAHAAGFRRKVCPQTT